MATSNPPPNAQWASWVQEAADHAAGNGSRSCDTYRRAARAIRLHPEELHHPSQALSIKGVGVGIARLITSRLQQHCQDNGIPFPVEPASQRDGAKRKRNQSNRRRRDLELTAEERALDASSGSDEGPSLSNGFSVTQRVRVTQKKKVRRRNTDLTPSELALDQSDSSDSTQRPVLSNSKNKAKTTTKPTKKVSPSKDYIPNRRTGCWGMLVALYILTVERPGPFTKLEIIEHAQDYCDSSYVERSGRGGGAGNNGHYTAWNMKKLLSEGLTASAPGRPPKFVLTKTGFEVASILAEKENCDLKEFDKSKLPDGIFKIDWNVTQVGKERGEEESRPSDSLINAKASKTVKTARKKDRPNTDKPYQVQPDCDAQAKEGHEPQQSTHEIESSYQTTLANNSLGFEEFVRQNPPCNQSMPPGRGQFQFWYLDRNGYRVKKLDEADSRMHPSTFETLYQVEYQEIQSAHPVRRSSIVDEPTLRPRLKLNSKVGAMLIGWMYESKAIPNCPGFTLPSSSTTGGVTRAELHESSINPSLSLHSTINVNLLKPPSSSLVHQNFPRTSISSDRAINLFDGCSHSQSTLNSRADNPKSTSVLPNRLLQRTLSGAGSMTPVGSFASTLSEDDTHYDHSPQIIDSLRSSDRHGLKNQSMTCADSMNGGVGSETPNGLSSSESASSHEISLDQSTVQSLLKNQTQSNLFKRTPSNLSEINFTQTTGKPMADTQADTLPPLSTMRDNESGINLKRTLSNLSENQSGQTRMTAENIHPKTVESFPTKRRQASLRRTPSNLSEHKSNPPRMTSDIGESIAVELLPSKRTQVNLKRTCSNLSEKHFHQISNTTINISQIEPEVWKAGAYDLYLILDRREIGSLNDREAMYNMCQTKAKKLSEEEGDEGVQIHVLQRALVLGDALWIAVNRIDKREVVLDSIVERKRLDDLCASVKDNRFSEQKARLKRSGLRNPIYLVEAYNTHSNSEINGPMINTAKSEVMLLNDFQLELTTDWKDSVDFLMRRTEVIRELHKKIDLTLIPEAEIEPINYVTTINELRRKEPNRYWVTTYKNFEILNNKSSNLTITELWARMVSCLSGMSTEKATNFVENWTTPFDFWNEVQQHQQDQDQLRESAEKPEKSHPWDWIEKKSNHHSLSLNQMNPVPSIGHRSVSSSSTHSNNSNGATVPIGTSLAKRIWQLYTSSEY